MGWPRFWLRIPAASRYTAAGVVLGTGAPLGALLLRLAGGSVSPAREWEDHTFFYIYALIGTCAVFGLAGFYAGRRADHLRRSRDRFETLSNLDPLTHLLNARAFRSRYRRALEHAANFREPISLLLLDVDDLKSLNDRWGHLAGSAALRLVAEILKESKREEDLAARWGGDEFVVLMPGAGPAAAKRLARTILERVRERRVRGAGQLHPVTVTIGIAGGTVIPSGEDLFELADRALFEGKREGRDRFRIAEPLSG